MCGSSLFIVVLARRVDLDFVKRVSPCRVSAPTRNLTLVWDRRGRCTASDNTSNAFSAGPSQPADMAGSRLALEGPAQHGQGQICQYVYWICMPFPRPETVQAQGVKIPDDFDRQSFRQVVVGAHTFHSVGVPETVCLLVSHASGKNHLNLPARAQRAHRWRKVAERLLAHRKIHAGFLPVVNHSNIYGPERRRIVKHSNVYGPGRRRIVNYT